MIVITSPIIEREGVLGFVNKAEEFVELTNWAPTPVGYVTDENTATCLGIIIQHAPVGFTDDITKK